MEGAAFCCGDVSNSAEATTFNKQSVDSSWCFPGSGLNITRNPGVDHQKYTHMHPCSTTHKVARARPPMS